MPRLLDYARAVRQRLRRRQQELPPNPFVEFACFRRDRLRVEPTKFRARIAEFQDIERNGPNQRTDYRNAFWFQFPTTFDGLAEIHEFYRGVPLRSLELMELIAPHVGLDGKDVLVLGSHNGAELYWLYDHSSARIQGVDANRHFASFTRFLIDSFGLQDRLGFREADVVGHLLGADERYDVIIAHGLLYMLWDPFLFLRAARARLKEGGTLSIEVYLTKAEGAVMRYLGDGSGWGDTFGFTLDFLEHVLPEFGFTIQHVLDYRGRRVFILRKDPTREPPEALRRLLEAAAPSKAAPPLTIRPGRRERR